MPFYKPTEVSRQLPQVPSGNRRPKEQGSTPAGPWDAAVSEKLMEQATTAGIQDPWKAEESCSDHLGEGKCTERARLETTECILSGAGTPKSEFRVDWLCPRQEKHTTCASQKSKSEIPTMEDGEGHLDSRAFARC